MGADDRPARCLITGATGFIGSQLCQRLKDDGTQRFVALVHNPQRAARLGAAGVDTVAGDLLDPAAVARALSGCDAVVHLAHGIDREAPTATRNLVEGAITAGVRRFIHISSMSVHGPAPVAAAAREATATIGRYDDTYCNAKAQEEEIVQRAMDRGTLPAVILRPTVVYGPDSPFVKQVVAEAVTGTVTVFDDGSGLCNAVYVDDVCDAIDAALVQGPALGHAMFINADRAITWKDFIATFANFVQPAPQIKDLSSIDALAWWAANPRALPSDSGGLLGRVKRKVASVMSPAQSPPFPPPGRVMRETVRVEFVNEQAKRLLGWNPKVNFAAGAATTQQWLRTTDLLQ
jgi:nucleoside-diphosphate-sugar epimerase